MTWFKIFIKNVQKINTSRLSYFQLQRKASETSLRSQPYSSSERHNMLTSMSRKSSVISLGGTPRSKRTVTQQSDKCPYCERVFGFKGVLIIFHA